MVRKPVSTNNKSKVDDEVPRQKDVHLTYMEVRVYKPVRVSFTEEQLMNIFRSHDSNGDRKLSWKELKAAFGYLGSRWDSFRAVEALLHADTDHDGYIEKEELKKLVHYAQERGYTIG
jgi:Ca2+-binding EF-hand superfamily protein